MFHFLAAFNAFVSFLPILIALALLAGAAFAYAYVPLAGKYLAGICLVLALMIASFEFGLFKERVSFEKREASEEAARQESAQRETDRRNAAIKFALDQATEAADALAKEREKTAALQQRIDDASHVDDSKPCLSVSGLRDLNAIGGRFSRKRVSR